MDGLGLRSLAADRESACVKKDEAAPETRLIHTRADRLGRVTVNPPLERASTVLFRDGAGAQFNCVSFTPLGHDTPKCSDTYGSGSGAGPTGGR